MAKRKTVEVAQVVEWVNKRLDMANATHRLGGQDLTPEQAFRMGVASLLEQILHSTGNYRGFGYKHHPDHPEHDETRRIYYR